MPHSQLLSSHELAHALLDQPDLPIAMRAPAWAIWMPVTVERVVRAAVATPDSLAERLEVILIQADETPMENPQ